jgi:ribosomal-protein-alanine N-acetyltransferase
MSIALRPYRQGDLDHLASLVTDPRVMQRVGGCIPRDEVAGLLDRYLRGDDDPRIVAVRAAEIDGVYVGSGQLVVSTLEPDALEVGYLVHADHQQRGIGTAIARALAAIADTELGGRRLIATVDLDHAASRRVLEKAGFALDRIATDGSGDYAIYARAAARPGPG